MFYSTSIVKGENGKKTLSPVLIWRDEEINEDNLISLIISGNYNEEYIEEKTEETLDFEKILLNIALYLKEEKEYQ